MQLPEPLPDTTVVAGQPQPLTGLEKAARDAVDAAHNSEQLAMVMALLQAQRITNQPQAQCQHTPAPRQSGSAAKWIGIGVGGSVLMISFALSAMAVAISAVVLTVCLLVLRSVWQDMRKGK